MIQVAGRPQRGVDSILMPHRCLLCARDRLFRVVDRTVRGRDRCRLQGAVLLNLKFGARATRFQRGVLPRLEILECFTPHLTFIAPRPCNHFLFLPAPSTTSYLEPRKTLRKTCGFDRQAR